MSHLNKFTLLMQETQPRQVLHESGLVEHLDQEVKSFPLVALHDDVAARCALIKGQASWQHAVVASQETTDL